MKRASATLIGIAVAISVYFVSVLPAFSADSATLDLKVAVSAPCITLGTTSIDFGTIRFATNPPSGATGVQAPAFNITSCAIGDETLYARGTDAASTTSSATWTLTSSNPCNLGPNHYGLRVSEQVTPFAYRDLTTTAQALPTALAGGATKPYAAGLSSPCTGSSGAGETMTMQIVFTTAF